MNLRGSMVKLFHRGSVCRAGGKASTGFAPGTRRAETSIFRSFPTYLHADAFNHELQIQTELIDFFIIFQNLEEQRCRSITKV